MIFLKHTVTKAEELIQGDIEVSQWRIWYSHTKTPAQSIEICIPTQYSDIKNQNSKAKIYEEDDHPLKVDDLIL